MGIYSSASRLLSSVPITTHVYFFLIAIYSFSFSLCFLLLIFPSLDDMLTFCESLSVFWDCQKRVWQSLFYFLDPDLFALFLPLSACYFSLQNLKLGLCVILKEPCGQTWVLTCDTSCLQGFKVPIMVSGSGCGKSAQALGVSSRLDSPFTIPQDELLTCPLTT